MRQARRTAGLALRDLPRRSGDHFKASAVGGYERGERSISVERFCQLCTLYGVYPGEVLTKALLRGSVLGAVRVDVDRLRESDQREANLLIDLVDRVRKSRGDENDGSLVVRAVDIEALAVSNDLATETLLERLGPAVSVVSH